MNVDGEREHDEELDLDPKTTASSKYVRFFASHVLLLLTTITDTEASPKRVIGRRPVVVERLKCTSVRQEALQQALKWTTMVECWI